MNRSSFVAGLSFLLGVLVLSLPIGTEVQVPVGGGRGPLMMSGLGPSEPGIGLSAEEVADARRDFYFRQLQGNVSHVSAPLLARGSFSAALRMDSTVRTKVDVRHENAENAAPPSAFATSGPWKETAIAANLSAGVVAFDLLFEDAPLVRRSDKETFRRYVDAFVFRSEEGFAVVWTSRIAGGVLLALLVLLTQATSLGARGAWISMTLGTALLTDLLFREPVALGLALPRLVVFVVPAAFALAGLGRCLVIRPPVVAALSLMSSAMIVGYGYLSFLPNHAPADQDIHIWRTLDLAQVPPSYDAWLRYGSHYPTPSQARGAATEALGEGPMIPYSPLPYMLFYGAHALGLDLHWSMHAVEATSLALVLPLIFAFGRAAVSETAGLVASGLWALDLAAIHHLGRAHAPAVAGGALGIAGLLAFGLALPGLAGDRNWRGPACLLGLGTLGYSSTPLFYAVFGGALLTLVLVQRETRPLLVPAFRALAFGGILALLFFYGHYVPGLLRGGGSALGDDAFPGRTFFIFHNESRQSLRLWRLGLYIPLLAMIPALAFVTSRVNAMTRSFVWAWIAAWAGVMLLKEPWAFPRVLRWAKEDLYMAPCVALVLGLGIARVETRSLRWSLVAVTLLVAALLRARDYGFHADTLRFLR